jgi:hypothetical protein
VSLLPVNAAQDRLVWAAPIANRSHETRAPPIGEESLREAPDRHGPRRTFRHASVAEGQSMTTTEVVAKTLISEHAEFPVEAVAMVVAQLMEAEIAEAVGARRVEG